MPNRPFDLDAIKQRFLAATPGPWRWAQDEFDESIAPVGADGKRRAKKGHRIGETFLYLLLGRSHPSSRAIASSRHCIHDYYQVMRLNWWDIKGTIIGLPNPVANDAEFIGNAWTDIQSLIAEVQWLRGEEVTVYDDDEDWDGQSWPTKDQVAS